jgi:creatinine deaminase
MTDKHYNYFIATDPYPTDEYFLSLAVEEAKAGFAAGGIPIGSTLRCENILLGSGHNMRIQKGDPTAHGEISCLRNAGRQATYRNTTLYSTLMPCFMCAGAIIQFKIPRVVIGDMDSFIGGKDLLEKYAVKVIYLQNDECIELLQRFIKKHPEAWAEDIGE